MEPRYNKPPRRQPSKNKGVFVVRGVYRGIYTTKEEAVTVFWALDSSILKGSVFRITHKTTHVERYVLLTTPLEGDGMQGEGIRDWIAGERVRELSRAEKVRRETYRRKGDTHNIKLVGRGQHRASNRTKLEGE